ncbi:MAG: DsrE/DsrF/DrsH-like family protein [Actinomycetota bacterium]|nr:DsrE/DsrF/DrsH-like family protein [Actinomycetota bacterium]
MALEDEAKIVYVQTHGTDEPSKAATPFYLATAAAAMDMEVSIYFTMHGPELLKKGTGDTLTVKDGGAPLHTFISQAQDIGVRFLVCQPSLNLVDLEMEDLIDGVEMIGGAAFNFMAVEADAVISF